MQEETFGGKVDGIDVQAFDGLPVRCQAILNPPGGEPVQIDVLEPRLQSALELASAKQCLTEVTCLVDGSSAVAVRVRLLDRD